MTLTKYSVGLWERAWKALDQRDRDEIPQNMTLDPKSLIADIEDAQARSKGKPVKLPGGEDRQGDGEYEGWCCFESWG